MIEVLVNADDFGLTKAVNYGILDSHKYGIVNSTTIMMNAKATEHAIELAKKTPSLKVGIHLVLTWGKPLLNDVPSLVDESGFFKKQGVVYENPARISLSELEREWSAQIERFLEFGLFPTHFDSHHHVHGITAFLPVIQNLSDKYGLPVRNAGMHLAEIQTVTDVFLDDFYGEMVVEDYFQNLKGRVIDGASVEIMTHPAYMDEELMEVSSYNDKRLKETRILTNAKLPEGFSLRFSINQVKI
ncbi:chitin disaccharide deacetylase [Peribacillus simplex]|uniref:chitin disaccharide deacetylase n=1 Tax=Peribacillus simplex TaxID=1478 RepID=UPI000F62DD17|nr:chitin disaccharide deacetylase [Peribacillus simplex]RRN66733.1 chitin disaccharide deacetylase [Peribacillus simplex]